MSTKKIVKAVFFKGAVITENSDAARELFNKNSYGILLQDGKIQLSLFETFYLMEKKRLELFDGRNKKIDIEQFPKKIKKTEVNFSVKYVVFRDMRDRGYVIKTALKFGADFRVYDRGIKPGQDHARWVVYPVNEGSALTWHEFAAKNRVAHSTKKRLMIAIVDDESSCTYYEIVWKRP